MTLRKLVHIFAVDDAGAGRIVAPLVEINWAGVIAEAVEREGFTVIMDPPMFGTVQNVISWSGDRGIWNGPIEAAPWREYLEVRRRTAGLLETFDEVYERVESEDKYGDPYPKWRMRS